MHTPNDIKEYTWMTLVSQTRHSEYDTCFAHTHQAVVTDEVVSFAGEAVGSFVVH